MTRLKVLCLLGAMCFAGLSLYAGEKLDLKSITRGEFSQETMTAVRPMADGETYTQISADGKQIVSYSFRTGKQESVVFDAATARGGQVNRVDNYIMSPDGRRILIQTQTKPIYRRSFTAVYYIYDIKMPDALCRLSE